MFIIYQNVSLFLAHILKEDDVWSWYVQVLHDVYIPLDVLRKTKWRKKRLIFLKINNFSVV